MKAQAKEERRQKKAERWVKVIRTDREVGCSTQAVIMKCEYLLFFLCVCVFCRDQLDIEKRKRETIEKEKEQMEREKLEMMTKLYEFEETTKRAERGGTRERCPHGKVCF